MTTTKTIEELKDEYAVAHAKLAAAKRAEAVAEAEMKAEYDAAHAKWVAAVEGKVAAETNAIAATKAARAAAWASLFAKGEIK